jgi:hypothetical protein
MNSLKNKKLKNRRISKNILFLAYHCLDLHPQLREKRT